MLPSNGETFEELSKWYFELDAVKNQRSFDRKRAALDRFNEVFGEVPVGSIKPMDLESYQIERLKVAKPATVDLEFTIAKHVVTKAADNDLIDLRPMQVFRKIKKTLKKGENTRKRILTFEEFISLKNAALDSFRPMLELALFTGMRKGELLKLKWEHCKLVEGVIDLPPEICKEKRGKLIPPGGSHQKAVVINAKS